MLAGTYFLIREQDWYFTDDNYPETCRKDSCVYIKQNDPNYLQYCFTPTDPADSPAFSTCGELTNNKL